MKKEGTKICKHCKSEISADAKICPHCRKKQGVAIWKIVLIAIIVIGVISAVFGGGSNDEPKSSGDTKTTSSKKEEKKETKKEFTQGEIVNFKGVEYSVTNVNKTTGSDFDNAKDGYEYVIVTVKIENKSDKKISYNPYDWKMENSNGQEEDNAFTTVDSDTSLNSGDLNPGGVVEGTIAYEEPQGDAGLKLNYFDNSVFDEEASFKIILN